jgi:hypothetical protein
MGSLTRTAAACAAAAFQRHTFTAWQTQGGQAHPVNTGEAETLADAVAKAARYCPHKATLFVLQRDELTGHQVLSISAIKARKVWRKCPDSLITKQVSETYADELQQVRMSSFVPWSFDVMADPVGRRDAGCIDVVSA